VVSEVVEKSGSTRSRFSVRREDLQRAARPRPKPGASCEEASSPTSCRQESRCRLPGDLGSVVELLSSEE